MLKPFMRYRGNKICPYEGTRERGIRTARKHNTIAEAVRGRKHKENKGWMDSEGDPQMGIPLN